MHPHKPTQGSETSHAAGYALDTALASCLQASCHTPCPATYLICDSGLGMERPERKPCADCLSKLNANGGCCEEAQQCDPNVSGANGQECLDLFTCHDGCTTQTCITTCGTSFPLGKAALDALHACMGSSCATECSWLGATSEGRASAGTASGRRGASRGRLGVPTDEPEQEPALESRLGPSLRTGRLTSRRGEDRSPRIDRQLPMRPAWSGSCGAPEWADHPVGAPGKACRWPG